MVVEPAPRRTTAPYPLAFPTHRAHHPPVSAPAESISDWKARLAGRFIVFDGPDGSGKSTQFHKFTDFAIARGVTVCEVREPGGTAIGEEIRRVLLDHRTGDLDVTAEMLLYMASRAQLIAERIVPALSRGELVLADRFVSSTLAYQGAAGGMSLDDIRAVAAIACRDVSPDLTVIFDVTEETAASRLSPLLDRMEAKGAAYHRRVRQGYLDQAKRDPAHYLVIDANGDAKSVWSALVEQVGRRLSAK